MSLMRRPTRALRRMRRLGLAPPSWVLARGSARPARAGSKSDARRLVVGTDGQAHKMGSLPKPKVPSARRAGPSARPTSSSWAPRRAAPAAGSGCCAHIPTCTWRPGGREIHFWDAFHTRWPGPEDVERYHRMFPRPPGMKAGEKTPQYMSLWWAPVDARCRGP